MFHSFFNRFIFIVSIILSFQALGQVAVKHQQFNGEKIEFLSLSPSGRFVIFTKEDFNDLVFLQILDRQTNTTSQFSTEQFHKNRVIVEWGNSDNRLFFSDGHSVFDIDISGSVSAKLVYNSSDEIISLEANIDINYLGLGVESQNSSSLLLINLEDEREIVQIEKSEGFRGFLTFEPKFGNCIFLANQSLRCFNLERQSTVEQIDFSYVPIALIGDLIFYVESNQLIALNTKSSKVYSLFNFPNLQVNHIRVTPDGILMISFNNQVILIDESAGVAKIIHTSKNESKVTYCDERILIEEGDENLVIYNVTW